MFKEIFRLPPKENKKRKKEPDLERRRFLTTGGKIMIGAGLASAGAGMVIKGIEALTGNEPVRPAAPEGDKAEVPETETTGAETEDKDQEMIASEDARSLEEMIDFSSAEQVKLSPEALEKHWENKYRGELRPSLEYAYREMGAYDDRIKAIFERCGVPVEYRYLAIPESHWRLKAGSRAGAKGPYQFTAATGDHYGLRRGDNFDERYDPLKSAEACARNLFDLHKRFGDWNIALSGYNGGFVWDYKRIKARTGGKTEYRDYLGHLEKLINRKKTEAKEMAVLKHRVKEGETAGKIARLYNMSLDELTALNPSITSRLDRLRIGEKLILPAIDLVRKKVFFKMIDGYRENINYPAKFNAINNIISAGELDGLERQPALVWEEATVAKTDKVQSYRFQAEDRTLFNLAKKLGLRHYNEIMKVNPGLDPRAIRAGTILNLPAKSSPMSLTDMAEATGRPLGLLIEINPAVIDARKPLPLGYKIRT